MKDTRGAVTTEYVVLVGAVGLVAALALVAAGTTLLKSYENSRDALVSPFP